MLRLLATAICLAFGTPAPAAPFRDGSQRSGDVPRAETPREDVAEIWLRESARRP